VPVVTGRDLRNARRRSTKQPSGRQLLAQPGRRRNSVVTQTNIGRQLGIVLDNASSRRR
jgi:preprotein translocase subunit SecD